MTDLSSLTKQLERLNDGPLVFGATPVAKVRFAGAPEWADVTVVSSDYAVPSEWDKGTLAHD